MVPGRWGAAAVAAMVLATAALPAAAQQTAFKGGVSVSRLQTDMGYWDDRIVTSTFGGHLRFRFGPLVLQPELHVITKGATASQPEGGVESDELRLEYLEVPLLVVVPIRLGALEPFVAAGPALMLESRCRNYIRQDGFRTNLPCEPARGQLFERTAFDYGVVAAAGASYPVLGGRALVEARHSRGLRDVHRRPGDFEAMNRTFSFLAGFAMGWQ
jgi:hypothetical protein